MAASSSPLIQHRPPEREADPAEHDLSMRAACQKTQTPFAHDADGSKARERLRRGDPELRLRGPHA